MFVPLKHHWFSHLGVTIDRVSFGSLWGSLDAGSTLWGATNIPMRQVTCEKFLSLPVFGEHHCHLLHLKFSFYLGSGNRGPDVPHSLCPKHTEKDHKHADGFVFRRKSVLSSPGPIPTVRLAVDLLIWFSPLQNSIFTQAFAPFLPSFPPSGNSQSTHTQPLEGISFHNLLLL